MGSRSINIGITVLGLGGLLIAVYQIRPDIQREVFPLSDQVFRGMLFLAIVLCFAGIFAILLPLIHYLRRPAASLDRLRRVVKDITSDPRYDCVVATREQLRIIHQLGITLIGAGGSSLADMLELHEKNPEIFWAILDTPRHGAESEIVGFFSLVPVNKKTADLLERGKITGAWFTIDNIITRGGKPSAIYVGGVAAKTGRARSAALAYLIDRLEARGRNVRVFTRPVTPDGLKLLSKYNFTPVANGKGNLGTIYKASKPLGLHIPSISRERRPTRRSRRPTTDA